MQLNMEKNETFRFATREEYETAIEKILRGGQKKRRRTTERVEVEYEELLEEYLRFCSQGEDA